jgi:hypothetical protein
MDTRNLSEVSKETWNPIPQYVPEVDVLIAVVRWLRSEDWTIESLSIARGKGINSADSKNRVKAELVKLGIEVRNVRFASTGEDIRAEKGGSLWRVECKGLADSMKPPTIRNQFDRALASVVSYYDHAQRLQLGLALPEEYSKHIRDRLPETLRTALNLWVFLYVSADAEIYAFAPHEELPL